MLIGNLIACAEAFPPFTKCNGWLPFSQSNDAGDLASGKRRRAGYCAIMCYLPTVVHTGSPSNSQPSIVEKIIQSLVGHANGPSLNYDHIYHLLLSFMIYCYHPEFYWKFSSNLSLIIYHHLSLGHQQNLDLNKRCPSRTPSHRPWTPTFRGEDLCNARSSTSEPGVVRVMVFSMALT